MFTSVDADKKSIKHFSKESALVNSDSVTLNSNQKRAIFLSIFEKVFSINDYFSKLQLAIFGITFLLSCLISIITGVLIDTSFGLSVFIGAIAGIFYLRLLAKSIGNLGKTSSGVSKVQLLIPISLFIFASKLEFLEILPAMLGFFIYKPAIIFYFSRS